MNPLKSLCSATVLASVSLAAQPGAVVTARQGTAPGQLMAGTAKIDMTPAIDAVSPGAARSEVLPVLSIRDHLYVRAIYFTNGVTCGALVSMDVVNPRVLNGDREVQRAADSIGCPRMNIVLSATHTHSAGTKFVAGGTAPPPADSMPDAATINAAVFKAITEASKSARAARIGYGKTSLYINVNKEIYAHDIWFEGTDPGGPSDKTLAVVGFIAADGTPIGVYVNYAAHPTDYYLTGILSAAFPGDATDYIERRYDNKTVALFSEAAAGDQSGIFQAPFLQLKGVRRNQIGRADDRIGMPEPWYQAAQALDDNLDGVKAMSSPMIEARLPAYEKAKGFNNEIVHAYGVMMGEASIEALKNPEVNWQSTPVFAALTATVSCPGRDRLDTSARQGVLPPYRDGEPVKLEVSALRIGDINMVGENGEVYTEISAHLKRVSPAGKTLMVTLTAGSPANSGYIYSNAASNHLTFEVIGSRLKPGCAEDAIVASAVSQLGALNH